MMSSARWTPRVFLRASITSRTICCRCTAGASRLCRQPEQLHGELLTLPLHPGLSREDVEAVCAGIIEAVK